MEPEQNREMARSKVRRVVTYIAAGYTFGGAAVLVAASFVPAITAETLDAARTAYMLAAPLSGMVVGWWFAKRDEERASSMINQ